MNIRKRREKDITILYLEGKIDIDSANFIEETSNLIKSGHRNLLCNFSNINMVDYNGLSIIVIAYKNVVNNGGIMKLCAIPQHVKELYKLVRLDLVFDVYEDEPSAIKSYETSTKIDKLYLRRRFKRLDLQLPVTYKLPSDSKVRKGKILNMSAEGIFIYIKESLPVSSQIEIELGVHEIGEPIRVLGRIVWLADKELQPHCYPGLGVKFLDVKPAEQGKIIDFIDKNITHRSEL
ncbi:MAG: PilZ domain-containing protein [Candidatus Omnitrophica bacterium]|nr:PilZ domain-containing protein [Candidatus Omnitrophota bacterium]